MLCHCIWPQLMYHHVSMEKFYLCQAWKFQKITLFTNKICGCLLLALCRSRLLRSFVLVQLLGQLFCLVPHTSVCLVATSVECRVASSHPYDFYTSRGAELNSSVSIHQGEQAGVVTTASLHIQHPHFQSPFEPALRAAPGCLVQAFWDALGLSKFIIGMWY